MKQRYSPMVPIQNQNASRRPAVRAGEEAYVFLWGREGEPFRVLGWSQGTFRISRDERTGVELATQDSAAASIFDPQTRKFRHGGIRNLAVSIFQLKLRKALQEKRNVLGAEAQANENEP